MLKKSNKGFTLIELIVTAAVLAILAVSVIALFVSALRTERGIFASKKVLSQVSYTMEYMGRALRMAKKDTAGDGINCIPIGSNYYITARNGIRFINSLQAGDCQEFFLENGQIKVQTNIDNPPSATLELTSLEMTVTSLEFNLSGQTQGPPDSLQPFVAIYLSAYSKNSPEFKVQTALSQRNPYIRQ
jgi:prepilin-type N-terminal cleavage/methylation domain-containing protein